MAYAFCASEATSVGVDYPLQKYFCNSGNVLVQLNMMMAVPLEGHVSE